MHPKGNAWMLRPCRGSGTHAPALGACEEPFDEALGHPPVVNQERQIRVDQRIGCGESLPNGWHTAKTIDDPLVTVDEIGVYLQVFIVRDWLTIGFKLDHVHGKQWQSSHI